ncbi:tape measure protein [Mammaliicoccus sciuri]
MSLRQLAIDIMFNSDVNKLLAVNTAVDDIRDSAIDSGGSIAEMGSVTESATSSMFSKLDGIGTKMSGIGKNMTKWITAPAVGAATALGGIALVKGFDRLVGIDTARAKLKGLGHDAEGVDVIMTSALDSVKGTSFGMGEAATTAANAAAAGVKPGKELTKYLTLTGDAAAIAGMGMGEMGSILNKVQTSSKAYNGELQQLSDRGLPIYQWLADEAGVTGDAVFKMASDGKISSKMLMNAIENNIGGAAKTMGEESFTAGMANMWSAVGRLGASFLDAGGKGGGFFSKLKPLISDITARVDDMGGIAEKAGEKFGDFFSSAVDKVKSAKSTFDGLSPIMQGIVKYGALIGSAFAISIGPVLMVLGSILTKLPPLYSLFTKVSGAVKTAGGIFAILTNPITLTVAAIGLIIGALVLAYNKIEWFRDGVNAAWDWIKESSSTAFGWIRDIVMNVFGVAMEFAMSIVGRFKDFWDTNSAFIMFIVQDRFNGIVSTIQMIMGIIQGIFQIAWPLISGIVTIAWELIKTVISTGIDIVLGLISAGMAILQGDWSGAWEIIRGIGESIWHNIENFFRNVNLFEIGANILQGLINGIGSMKDAVLNKVSDIAGGIASKFKGALQIFSPSRLFKEYGVNTMMGYQIGFEDQAEHASDAAENVGYDIAGSFNPETSPPSNQSSTQGVSFNPRVEIIIQGDADGQDVKRELERYFPELMEEFFAMLAAKRGGEPA